MKKWILIYALSLASAIALPPSLSIPATAYRLLPPPPPPLDPAQIPETTLWIKGETITGVTEGGSVSNWVNSAPVTGTSWYFTNATSSRWPTLTNGFGGTTNKALVFDGTDDYLFLTGTSANGIVSSNILNNASNCAVVAVAMRVAPNGNRSYFTIIDSGSIHRLSQDVFTETISTRIELNKSVSLPSASFTNNILRFRSDVVYTNKLTVTGSSISIYTNGVLGTTGSPVVHTNSPATINTTYLGGSIVNVWYWKGQLAELILFIPSPSAATLDRLDSEYLKPKYGP